MYLYNSLYNSLLLFNFMQLMTEGVVSLECEGINLFGLQVLNPEIVDHRTTMYTHTCVRTYIHTYIHAYIQAYTNCLKAFSDSQLAIDPGASTRTAS